MPIPTIADLLGVIDRFKRNPWESAQDYAVGAARSLPEAGASIIDMFPRQPGATTATDWLNQRLLGTPLEAKGTNTEGAGGLLGFPGAGTALKGGAAALGKLGGLLGAGVMTYHGTPHAVKGWDLSKVGSGQGAQSFGHGMYFAENPATAKSYREMLAGKEVRAADDTLLMPGMPPARGVPLGPLHTVEAKKFLEVNDGNFSDAIDMAKVIPEKDKDIRDAIVKQLREWEKAGAKIKPAGNLYQQDLPDEILPKMLHWDKPLSPDSPTRKILADAATAFMQRAPSGIERNWAKDAALAAKNPNTTGEGLYHQLARLSSKQGAFPSILVADPKAAAERLREAGIPGLSYLDAGSRASGQGTMNHVVWDQALLDLMRPQRVE